MLSIYLSLCALFGAALYPLRKTITVVVINVIFAIETSLGIFGFVYSKIFCILIFISSWSATVFMFLLYFLAVTFFKGDHMLWVVHGVPMLIDLVCLGFTAKTTLAYWNWRKTVPDQPHSTILGQAPSQSQRWSQNGTSQLHNGSLPASPPIIVGNATKVPSARQEAMINLSDSLEMPEREDGSDTCQICMTYRSNCCLVPCGHCVCMACGESIRATGCPICRHSISQLVRVYK